MKTFYNVVNSKLLCKGSACFDRAGYWMSAMCLAKLSKQSIFKRLVYTPPDSSPRFFLLFRFPFRQRNASCKLPATQGVVGLHDFYLIPKCCSFHLKLFPTAGQIKLWKVLHFHWPKFNVDLAACFTLRGHDTHYRFIVVFVSGRQGLPSDARAFSLTSFEA